MIGCILFSTPICRCQTIRYDNNPEYYSKDYPIEASDNIKQLMQRFQNLKIVTPEDIALQDLGTLWEPTPVTIGQGYGTSKYDKGIMTIDEAMDIKKVRIRNFEDSFEGKLLSSGVLGIVGWVMFLAIKQSL